MPPYAKLERTRLDYREVQNFLKANRSVGVPYTDEQIASAKTDLEAQADPDHEGADAMQKRYPKAVARDFDGQKEMLTEADALIAYLQMLGTLVDFKTYRADAPEHRR
jgi:cytochrome c oxidase cbb3-type subunit 2